MQRVTRSTAAASLPSPPASPGTPGYFTGGDPVGNVPPTVPGYEWFNGVQEELAALVLRAGLSLDAADLAQVRKGLDRLYGGGLRTVTGSVTLTADDAGVVLVNASGGNLTITLPAAGAANGRPLEIVLVRTDATGNTVTVQRAGSDLIEAQTSRQLPREERLVLRSNGIGLWHWIGGLSFGFSFGTSGWQRLPSGLIIQWGSTGWSAGALGDFGGSWSSVPPALALPVTFPIAFPTAALSVVSNGADWTGGTDGLECVTSSGLLTSVGCTIFVRRISGDNGGGADVGSVRWIALGS